MNSHFNPLSFPKLEKYVNDFSSILSEEDQRTLNEALSEHEKITTEQVVVVLFPHREGHELIDIGLKLFNENGIGQKGKNNGLLLLISTQEKKIRIITGKGMELKYSEMRCRDIIENRLRPLLDVEKYNELIKAFTQILISTENTTEGSDLIQDRKSRDQSRAVALFSGIISFFSLLFVDSLITGSIVIILGLLLLFIMKKIENAMKYKLGKLAYILSFFIIIIGICGILRPADCILTRESYLDGKTYHCERNVFGYSYSYSKSIGGHSSSSSNGSSSSSHWDSGGSSFGGGGGSSNGGGYGD